MTSIDDIYTLLEAQRKKLGLSQIEVGRRAFGKDGNSDLQNIRRGASPSVEKVEALCRVLDLDFHIGPRGQRESISGFSEAAASKIDPTIDGSPEALRMGYLPLPYNFHDPAHRGVSPLAFARAWLLKHDLEPENLSIVAMPGDDMAPSISADELLLIDGARKLTAEPELAAYLFDGHLGVGWAMEPVKGSVAVLFERKFSPPIALSANAISRYRHLGSIAARFDSLPSPWLSQQDKLAALERGRELVSKK